MSKGPVEEEEFNVNIRVGGGELIGFGINAKSTRIKRTMFFGLFALALITQLSVQVVPLLAEYAK